MNDPGSSRQVALPELTRATNGVHPESATGARGCRGEVDALAFQRSSQAQIIRAHQRDSAQIHRLIELASEIVRSIAGTRWLAHKQTIIDISIRAAYLILTLGRGRQTIGEEYTDILPLRNRIGAGAPGRARRLLTIVFLLFPSILTLPSFTAILRSSAPDSVEHFGVSNVETHRIAEPGRRPLSQRLWRKGALLGMMIRIWSHTYKWRNRLADLIQSPLGQSIPELHMVIFLYGGRFFEVGRRLTGLGYISTLAPNPNRKPPSFEPLAVLLGLPLLYRLLPWLSARGAVMPLEAGSVNPVAKAIDPALDPDIPLDPSSVPPSTSVRLDKLAGRYDNPNTYLTPEAQEISERQCTLCLEPRGTGEGSGGTVAVTECGHVFCWGCLGGLEKLECPLCRQSLRMERLIAAYNL